jgi:hypothetical protein
MNLNVNDKLLTYEEFMKCETSVIWGVYGILLMIVCFSLNSTLLAIILLNEELRSTTNQFLIAMLSAALIGSMTDLPLLII